MMHGQVVGLRDSSCETGEQGGAIRCGAGGAKGGDQGNADQQSTYRTQNRISVSQALDCMRQALAVWTRKRGRSRMRESCTYGSVRGALSNERPYRDLFTCPNCGHPLYFDTRDARVAACAPARREPAATLALEPIGSAWRARESSGAPLSVLANAGHDVCNSLVPAGHAETFSRRAPQPDNLRPSAPDNIALWHRIEPAKHRLFYTLLRLRLPLSSRPHDPTGST